MDAYDLAKPLKTDRSQSVVFGVDRKRTAEALRKLADDLDSERFHVISGRVVTLAKQEDFTTTIIRLQLAETREKAVSNDLPYNV